MTVKKETEGATISKILRVPKNLAIDFEVVAKKHRRSFNNEVIVAMENHLNNWETKH